VAIKYKEATMAMAISPTRSREIQLFDPPPVVVYTIEATSHL